MTKPSHIWRENDFDVTEQRIEGIEELVGRLEKTVQKLNRKVIYIYFLHLNILVNSNACRFKI